MTDARTLTDVLAELEADGFTGQFRAAEDGRVECEGCQVHFDGSDLVPNGFERLEGESDPADMMLVVAGRCPACDGAGTLVLTYGPMAPADDAAVEATLALI